MSTRSWIAIGLPAGAYEALAETLPLSRLWSLLLDVVGARASRRRPADLMQQWESDRFVRPSIVDPQSLIEIDRQLFAASVAFEPIELSPVAPLGVCSVMGRASQNKVLSALRGVEVVADPTNVMALECACRLRRDPATTVQLAASHRCVRTQQLPDAPGFTASFRMFCLASAALERADHGFVVAALAAQLSVMLDALDRLSVQNGAFKERRVTILATDRLAHVADRAAAAVGQAGIRRAVLEHPYYSGGLRFQIDVRPRGGGWLPIADGGAFDWLARLLSNRKAAYVASGFGVQLAALQRAAP